MKPLKAQLDELTDRQMVERCMELAGILWAYNEGFAIGDVTINGHAKVRVTTPSGAPMTIVISESPSDQRVQTNFRAQLRRFARQGTASTGDPKCARLTP
jgi:hypothetical protein